MNLVRISSKQGKTEFVSKKLFDKVNKLSSFELFITHPFKWFKAKKLSKLSGFPIWFHIYG